MNIDIKIFRFVFNNVVIRSRIFRNVSIIHRQLGLVVIKRGDIISLYQCVKFGQNDLFVQNFKQVFDQMLQCHEIARFDPYLRYVPVPFQTIINNLPRSNEFIIGYLLDQLTMIQDDYLPNSSGGSNNKANLSKYNMIQLLKTESIKIIQSMSIRRDKNNTSTTGDDEDELTLEDCGDNNLDHALINCNKVVIEEYLEEMGKAANDGKKIQYFFDLFGHGEFALTVIEKYGYIFDNLTTTKWNLETIKNYPITIDLLKRLMSYRSVKCNLGSIQVDAIESADDTAYEVVEWIEDQILSDTVEPEDKHIKYVEALKAAISTNKYECVRLLVSHYEKRWNRHHHGDVHLTIKEFQTASEEIQEYLFSTFTPDQIFVDFHLPSTSIKLKQEQTTINIMNKYRHLVAGTTPLSFRDARNLSRIITVAVQSNDLELCQKLQAHSNFAAPFQTSRTVIDIEIIKLAGTKLSRYDLNMLAHVAIRNCDSWSHTTHATNYSLFEYLDFLQKMAMPSSSSNAATIVTEPTLQTGLFTTKFLASAPNEKILEYIWNACGDKASYSTIEKSMTLTPQLVERLIQLHYNYHQDAGNDISKHQLTIDAEYLNNDHQDWIPTIDTIYPIGITKLSNTKVWNIFKQTKLSIPYLIDKLINNNNDNNINNKEALFFANVVETVVETVGLVVETVATAGFVVANIVATVGLFVATVVATAGFVVATLAFLVAI
ncbi:hypothetical protein DFA_03657 [Cavenderia fasciculata]|uniref:Uncharacterized protein n=1 Tax=Cavenderia fasciculata TaxID=261658 RepID=F4PIH9_CACFS|nr:uncharacterized protein DFA_03657 [Cavenderia fasciculata]EGG25408.1 hypothetical protein DFA_03657 [Cavenderia fasciculata]|eukprot:XP_004363259.1 hypothetical protein DFA_03657 [Cavenderia fasciculata]